MRLFILLFIAACSSPRLKPQPSPHCYLFLNTPVVKIKTQGDFAYMFGNFNNQNTFYWESLEYIAHHYLPDACSPELLQKAKDLL